MEKKERNKLINVIVFNIALISLFTYLGMSYTMPYNEELNLNIVKSNKIQDSVNKITENGLDLGKLNELTSSDTKYSKESRDSFLELLKAESKIKSVITKSGSSDYVTWLNKEVSRDSDNKAELDKNEEIIGQILPIFYQGGEDSIDGDDGDNQVKNRLTLESFISFFENKILRRFNIVSFISLGLDNVEFGKNSDTANTNTISSNAIGSFTVNIDLKGKNSDIYRLIDYIQNSGKLEFDKNNKGKLIKPTDDSNGFNNILMSIDNLSLSKYLADNNDINNGTIGIVFYVRGISLEQSLALKNKVNTEFVERLLPIINTYKEKYNNETLPINKDETGMKYIVALRNTSSDATKLNTDIQTKNKENTLLNVDVNKELNDRSKLFTRYKAIDQSFSNIKQYVDKYK